MRVRVDRMLYLDMEMSCWEGGIPAGMSNSIIQIGLVEMDLGRRVETRRQEWLVRPAKGTEISPYCTQLTGITQDQIRRFGRPLGEVLQSLAVFGPAHKAVGTWGNDVGVLRAACTQLTLPCPFEGPVVDLGFLWRIGPGRHHNGSVGLLAAMTHLGLCPEGPQHRAVVDAANTARLHMAWLAQADGAP